MVFHPFKRSQLIKDICLQLTYMTTHFWHAYIFLEWLLEAKEDPYATPNSIKYLCDCNRNLAQWTPIYNLLSIPYDLPIWDIKFSEMHPVEDVSRQSEALKTHIWLKRRQSFVLGHVMQPVDTWSFSDYIFHFGGFIVSSQNYIVLICTLSWVPPTFI